MALSSHLLILSNSDLRSLLPDSFGPATRLFEHAVLVNAHQLVQLFFFSWLKLAFTVFLSSKILILASSSSGIVISAIAKTCSSESDAMRSNSSWSH